MLIEWILLLVALLLVLANALFVAAEFSLVTVDRSTVERAVEADEPGARSVLTALPRDGLVVLQAAASSEEVQAATARSGFSRFPVVDGDGDPVGYLHVKDALHHRRGDTGTAGELARPLPTLAVADSLRDALGVMRGAGAHLAAVRDAGGRLSGVVALEDVLERLVGHITDGAAAPVPTG